MDQEAREIVPLLPGKPGHRVPQFLIRESSATPDLLFDSHAHKYVRRLEKFPWTLSLYFKDKKFTEDGH